MAKKTILLTESDFQALPAQNADDIGFARSEVETVTVRASATDAKKLLITRTAD